MVQSINRHHPLTNVVLTNCLARRLNLQTTQRGLLLSVPEAEYFDLHPPEITAVARMKHCSILALSVLCSQAYQADGVLSMNVKIGAEERDVCHG